MQKENPGGGDSGVGDVSRDEEQMMVAMGTTITSEKRLTGQRVMKAVGTSLTTCVPEAAVSTLVTLGGSVAEGVRNQKRLA